MADNYSTEMSHGGGDRCKNNWSLRSKRLSRQTKNKSVIIPHTHGHRTSISSFGAPSGIDSDAKTWISKEKDDFQRTKKIFHPRCPTNRPSVAPSAKSAENDRAGPGIAVIGGAVAQTRSGSPISKEARRQLEWGLDSLKLGLDDKKSQSFLSRLRPEVHNTFNVSWREMSGPSFPAIKLALPGDPELLQTKSAELKIFSVYVECGNESLACPSETPGSGERVMGTLPATSERPDLKK
ncbi:hypothetical protein C8J56DRAFT_892652 [Mycena floridula]|nr:hypothetical protein C8J56DRAFT_892652 [Mycena floridula]